MFFKIGGALKNFANFTGKHLCWSLFLIKLQAFRLRTSIKTVNVKNVSECVNVSIKTEKVSGKLTIHIPLTLMV